VGKGRDLEIRGIGAMAEEAAEGVQRREMREEYAVAHFEIRIDQFGDEWKAVFGGWLPESGYQPADGPCFEHCLNDPSEHPQGLAIVDICVPVKPL
jgi:DNA gyrase inhibitor GyrI